MNPTCPRCGYDQSGAIAAWNNERSLSCPTDGTCSECGLEFRWHDVIYADRLIVRGFVEHARGFWQASRWAWVTWAWTLWPPVFWRRVKMEHAPREWSMLAWLALGFGSVYTLIALLNTGALLSFYTNTFTSAPRLAGMEWTQLVDPWLGWLFQYRSWPPPGRWAISVWAAPVALLSGVSANIVAMLVLLVAPITRRQAKVRKVHVLRAAIYGVSCTWVIWIFETINCMQTINLFAMGGLTKGIRARSWFDGFLGNLYRLEQHHWPWIISLQVAWIAIWWRCATREMFRERATPSIVGTVVFVAIFGAIVGTALSDRLAILLAGVY